MKLAPDIDLALVAKDTHGFVGAFYGFAFLGLVVIGTEA